jgi:small conductance mechanosensitive channel
VKKISVIISRSVPGDTAAPQNAVPERGQGGCYNRALVARSRNMMGVSLLTVPRIVQEWQTDATEFLRHFVPKIVVALLLAFLLLWLLKSATARLVAFSRTQDFPGRLRAQQLRTLAGVMNSVGAVIIFFLTAMHILPLLGINMGPLLASAGIAGLAIGFGAQTLVRDVINGFFILMENQYDVGDHVRIGGVAGTVESMTLRRTVLRDTDGAVHVVPNSEIKIVTNLTRDWAQVSLHVSVAYSESSDRIIALLKEVGAELRNDPAFAEALVAEPDVPGIERVAGGEVEYLMLVKTRPEEQYRVSRELRRRIKEVFERNNVQPGNPQRLFVVDSVPASRA